MMDRFTHVVEIDEAENRINVYRLFDDGHKYLFTAYDLDKGPVNMDVIASRIGLDILIDSPAGRRLLGL